MRIFNSFLTLIIPLIAAFCPRRSWFHSTSESPVLSSSSHFGTMSAEYFQNDKYFDQGRIEAVSKIAIAISSQHIHTVKPIRCYCLSDLHADAERNQKWVRENCKRKEEDKDYFTVFIIPGDIGSEVDRIISVLKVSTEYYDAVCYIPGNHEAWRKGILAGGSALSPENRAANREAVDSVVKLVEVLDNAKALGVHVGPLKIISTYSGNTISVGTDSNSAALGECSIQDDKADFGNDQSSPESSNSSSSSISGSSSSVIVVPLYSWYHDSWDTEPELTHPDVLEMEEWMPFSKKWGDFSLCRWPEELVSHSEFTSLRSSTKLAESFAALNEPFLHPPPYKTASRSELPPVPPPPHSQSVYPLPASPVDGDTSFAMKYMGSPLQDSPSDTILSYSHFLPRIELCPEKRFLLEPGLSKVVGSDPLESQVRRLQPDLHMFGHTHIPIDLELEGIRYVQWPLGYHRESEKQCMPIHSSGPLLVFDSTLGTGKQGVPSDMASADCHWSQHYRKNPTRETAPAKVNELSWWLVKRLEAATGRTYSPQTYTSSSKKAATPAPVHNKASSAPAPAQTQAEVSPADVLPSLDYSSD